MSLNTAHADHGVLIHAGERIILYSDNVNIDFSANEALELKGLKQGRLYLTSHRMIFNSNNNTDVLRSFSFPFITLSEVTVEQPMFSANNIKGKCAAQPNGNINGEVRFKITFKSGGAIEFGTAMLKAAHLASRNMASNAPPPYTPPSGPWHAAPPPMYSPPPQGYYGWVPPYNTFPDQPPPNSVFVTPNPPPYPGVMTGESGAQGQGWQAPPPGYPGHELNGHQASAPPGYPGGFAAPGASANVSPGDAKAAEAAQSAYYDPSRPQTAYVPPPYDQPPSYQQSQSKKEN